MVLAASERFAQLRYIIPDRGYHRQCWQLQHFQQHFLGYPVINKDHKFACEQTRKMTLDCFNEGLSTFTQLFYTLNL